MEEGRMESKRNLQLCDRLATYSAKLSVVCESPAQIYISRFGAKTNMVHSDIAWKVVVGPGQT